MQDVLQILSDSQALTAVATVPSTNVFDFGVAGQFGEGYHVGVNCQVMTTFTSGGASTLQVAAQGSTDNITFNNLVLSAVFALAALTAGVQLLRIALPLRQLNMTLSVPYRYFRLAYIIGAVDFTGGAVEAWLAAIEDRDQIYAPARNFSAA